MNSTRRSAIASVGKILVGALLGQGLIVLISPLLTRLYSPADFTALAVVTAISAVLGSLATLTWDAAVVIPPDPRRAQALILLATLSTGVITIVIAILAFLLSGHLASWLSVPALRQYWWVIPVTVLGIALFKIIESWLIRVQDFGRIAVRNIAQGVGQAVFSVGLGFAGVAPLGLAASLAFGRITGAVAMISPSTMFARPGPDRMLLRDTAKRFRRFPLVTAWSYSLASLGLQLPVLLFAALYAGPEVGSLMLAIRVLSSPVGMLADAARQYYEARFSHALREVTGHPKRIFLSTAGWLALVSGVMVVVIVLAAPTVFPFVFGPEWAVSGLFAQILAIDAAFQLTVSPISASLTILERQRTQMIWNVSRLCLNSGAILVVAIAGGTLGWAVAGYAIAQAIAYSALFLITLRALSTRLRGTT